MKVLIADDDLDDLSFFCEALGLIDDTIECIQVTDGDEALSYLAPKGSALPDVIFLDINMPRMNGYELLKTIKTDSSLNHIPIVMWSTSTSPFDIDFFKKHDVLFLTKPSSINDLKTSLREILKSLT